MDHNPSILESVHLPIHLISFLFPSAGVLSSLFRDNDSHTSSLPPKSLSKLPTGFTGDSCCCRVHSMFFLSFHIICQRNIIHIYIYIDKSQPLVTNDGAGSWFDYTKITIHYAKYKKGCGVPLYYTCTIPDGASQL